MRNAELTDGTNGAQVLSMRDYLLGRRLSITTHQMRILRTYAEQGGLEELADYRRLRDLREFHAKMGMVALQRRAVHEDDRYPQEYGDFEDDER